MQHKTNTEKTLGFSSHAGRGCGGFDSTRFRQLKHRTDACVLLSAFGPCTSLTVASTRRQPRRAAVPHSVRRPCVGGTPCRMTRDAHRWWRRIWMTRREPTGPRSSDRPTVQRAAALGSLPPSSAPNSLFQESNAHCTISPGSASFFGPIIRASPPLHLAN